MAKEQPKLSTEGTDEKQPNGNGNGAYIDSHIWINRTKSGKALLMATGPEQKGQTGFPEKRVFIINITAMNRLLNEEIKGVMLKEIVNPEG